MDHTHRRDVTHILSKVSCFFYWNPFIFVGYRNDRFFPTQIHISNVTQQCRCSPMLICRATETIGFFPKHKVSNFYFYFCQWMELRTYFVPVFIHSLNSKSKELPQSLGCLWPDNLSHADLTTPGALTTLRLLFCLTFLECSVINSALAE